MSRKLKTFVVLAALVVLVLSAASILVTQQPVVNASTQPAREPAQSNAPEQQAVPGVYMWNYSVKFVCGFQPQQPSPGQTPYEPVVKPGNYATDINIHNYNYREVPVRKKAIVLVEGNKVLREPESAGPAKPDQILLRPDFATMDDCLRIWQLLHPGVVPPAVPPLLIGYLVILSPLDLDVDAVYTAEVPGGPNSQQMGISEDVERIPGKRVFVPAGALP